MKFNKAPNNRSYPQDMGELKETITEKDLKEMTEKNLKEGELICSKCKGVGFINKIKSDDSFIYNGSCPKCHGTGKLDWIENVLGKKPDNRSSSSSGTSSLSIKPFNVKWTEVPSGLIGTSGTAIRDTIIKDAADHLAKKIDGEILEILRRGG